MLGGSFPERLIDLGKIFIFHGSYASDKGKVNLPKSGARKQVLRLGFFLLRPLAALFEVLIVYDEQPERLAAFFGLFSMMSAMRPENSPGITVVQLPEPLEALMDVYVVDEEVNNAVDRDTNTDKEQPEVSCRQPYDIANRTRYSKDEEKQVVFLKETIFMMMRLVMVFVPVPQRPVHDVFMGEPRHEFHANNSSQGNKDISQYLHIDRSQFLSSQQ